MSDTEMNNTENNNEQNLDFEYLKQQAKELNIDVNELIRATLNSLKTSKLKNEFTETNSTSNLFPNLTQEKLDEVWNRVQLARHPDRPTTLEYIAHMSEQFIELHGDRYAGDDKAMVGGICTLDGIHFTFIGTQKGSNMKENLYRNYGMAHPEGYRKALRLAKQAENFGRPIITMIDTSGAYPGLASEERGIGEAIAKNLMEFSILEVPIICIIIGEGGSGGALGIGIGDKIYMMENSIYSVISPEGFASILLRDVKKNKEAACLMKITAEEVLSAGFIDGIIPESQGAAHINFEGTAETIKSTILTAYNELKHKDIPQLLTLRSHKIIDWTRYSSEKDKSIPNNKDFLSKIKEFFS